MTTLTTESARRLAASPWVWDVDPSRRLLSQRAYARLKRLLDITVVLALLPIAGPLMLLAALAVKLEDPRSRVLFCQLRTGRGGRRFRLLKFRTMVEGAEALKAELAARSALTWPDFKLRDDPRVTKVGRHLRRFSLDELPQLINVLRGDMSLVGPRPTFFDSDAYELWQTERLDVRPGLTGLWQLLARSDVDFADRSRLDIAYVQRACLLLDIRILLRTPAAVLRGRGAS